MGRILFIDTSSSKEASVTLREDRGAFCVTSDATKLKSQVLLLLIDKVLEDNEISLRDLTGIEVNLGPGSFTGLRVGVSVGNTLAFALKIPINGNKVGVLVEPLYNN